MVFDAYTKPELIKRWVGGHKGWELVDCHVDLRVGGAWRWVLRDADGVEMGLGGVYTEIVAPERLVNTETFDQPWYPRGRPPRAGPDRGQWPHNAHHHHAP